jgi:hypothetical protein
MEGTMGGGTARTRVVPWGVEQINLLGHVTANPLPVGVYQEAISKCQRTIN